MPELLHLLLQPTLETLEMVVVAATISGVLGTMLGVLLVITDRGRVLSAPWLFRALSTVTNIGRSIPFIILLVAIIPFTRWLVGSAIGTTAAMVPLVVGAIPYVARLVEATLREVDPGVIEAVLTMGATPWQVIAKGYLPEAVPGLIRAMTVVSITLVSYSAMAGAVGGGGLGDLAIRFGYQGFRTDVMVSTVAVLVLLIQAIQWIGDTLSRHYQRDAAPLAARSRRLGLRRPATILAGLAMLYVGFGISALVSHRTSAHQHPLRIGVCPIPHAEILANLRPLLQKQGVELEIIPFNDYIQPNLALASGDLDANFFQHVPFMDRFNEDHGTHVVSVARVHIEPLGLYPGRTRTLAQLHDGSVVAIANDPVNSGRGLLLLQSAGLLTLRTGSNINSTVRDIARNPRHLQISELEAAQLPRSLEDVDAAVINTNYALAAHLDPLRDALFLENSDSPYANILATVPAKLDDPRILAVARALQSDDDKTFILRKYKGAVIPAF